jgi:hypothetical protein
LVQGTGLVAEARTPAAYGQLPPTARRGKYKQTNNKQTKNETTTTTAAASVITFYGRRRSHKVAPATEHGVVYRLGSAALSAPPSKVSYSHI